MVKAKINKGGMRWSVAPHPCRNCGVETTSKYHFCGEPTCIHKQKQAKLLFKNIDNHKWTSSVRLAAIAVITNQISITAIETQLVYDLATCSDIELEKSRITFEGILQQVKQ